MAAHAPAAVPPAASAGAGAAAAGPTVTRRRATVTVVSGAAARYIASPPDSLARAAAAAGKPSPAGKPSSAGKPSQAGKPSRAEGEGALRLVRSPSLDSALERGVKGRRHSLRIGTASVAPSLVRPMFGGSKSGSSGGGGGMGTHAAGATAAAGGRGGGAPPVRQGDGSGRAAGAEVVPKGRGGGARPARHVGRRHSEDATSLAASRVRLDAAAGRAVEAVPVHRVRLPRLPAVFVDVDSRVVRAFALRWQRIRVCGFQRAMWVWGRFW